jgi:hypothetical protein
MNKRKKRLFQSLQQQLIYEIHFVDNVSKAYKDKDQELEIVDFDYKGAPYKLKLNGKIMLETNRDKFDVDSFSDLVHGLIKSNYRSKA